MAALWKLIHTSLLPRKYGLDSFSPVGLHVLLVDDDPLCLMILDTMLRKCHYRGTALRLLRDGPEEFDLVLSDVCMPDVDGFKLLKIVGLELDLPVIMMSANSDTNVVMKGIMHGACDYLIKPVRMAELKNIWQHVIRRKGSDLPPEVEFPFGRNDIARICKLDAFPKKQKIAPDFLESTVAEINSCKKVRVNWTFQLHQKFVNAVKELGVERAVPKKLLEIMNVRGLTREHVASHLQKYRLYLKRLSGTVPEPCPIASFQASKDGMSGTMRVIPGGKNSNSNSVVKGLKLRVGMGGSIKSLEGIVAMDINSEAQVKVCEPRSLEKCVREEAVGELAVSNHRSSPSGDTWQEEPDTCLQSHNKPQKDASDCGQSGPDLLFDMPNVCVEESTIVGIERGARFLLQNRDTGICVKDPEDLSDSDFSSHLKATPLPSIIGEQIAVNKNDSNCSSLDESVSDECSHDNLIFYQQDQSSDVICQEEVNVLDYLVEDPFILDG